MRFDWTGWNISGVLKGNKESFKLLIAAILGLWVPTGVELKVVVAAATKFILDALDYYLSK